MQRHHPRGGRSAERRDHAVPVVGFGQQRGVAALKTGTHFAVLAGAGACRNVVEDDARGLARLARPVGLL